MSEQPKAQVGSKVKVRAGDHICGPTASVIGQEVTVMSHDSGEDFYETMTIVRFDNGDILALYDDEFELLPHNNRYYENELERVEEPYIVIESLLNDIKHTQEILWRVERTLKEMRRVG